MTLSYRTEVQGISEEVGDAADKPSLGNKDSEGPGQRERWDQKVSSVSPPLNRTYICSTLRQSLSGTFLQTLPEFVTPRKGHYLRAAVHRRCQRPPKALGTKTAEAT